MQRFHHQHTCIYRFLSTHGSRLWSACLVRFARDPRRRTDRVSRCQLWLTPSSYLMCCRRSSVVRRRHRAACVTRIREGWWDFTTGEGSARNHFRTPDLQQSCAAAAKPPPNDRSPSPGRRAEGRDFTGEPNLTKPKFRTPPRIYCALIPLTCLKLGKQLTDREIQSNTQLTSVQRRI